MQFESIKGRFLRTNKPLPHRKLTLRTVNRDKGAYMVSQTWNAVLKKLLDSTGRGCQVWTPSAFFTRVAKTRLG